MSDDRETLLRELVRNAAARERRPRGEPDLPIIVLWGSRGSERFEPLARLDREMDWSGPHAFLDGERLSASPRPYEIAGWLAFRLGQRVPRFGRLRFPRLFLGMWAARNPLDPNSAIDPRTVRRDEIKRTFRSRSELRRWVPTVGRAIAGAAGVPGPVTEVLGMALAGALDFMSTRALLRGPGMRWYQDGVASHGLAEPMDGLVELSVREFLGDFEFVDEVLCRAFVDDLRAEFETGGGLFTRLANTVVLLDNVGTPALDHFVTMLAEQRAGSGPLLVVAASHRRYPAAASAEPAVWQPEALRQASLAGWSQWRRQRDQSRFYPVWVDPIDDVPPTAGPRRPEVRAIADHRALDVRAFSKLAFAYRLTAAHPDGLDMVLEALPSNSSGIDPRGVLGLDHHPGKRLDDTLFDLVLGPWPVDMRRGLVLMAIAVDLSNARVAPILADSTPLGQPGGNAQLAMSLAHDLMGAAVAQRQANRTTTIDGSRPYVRLVVANIGDSSAQWEDPVSKLIDMVHDGSDPRRVTAVAVSGWSLEPIGKAIDALVAAGVPVITGRLTADQLTSKPVTPDIPMVRVAPNNSSQAQAAAAYLRPTTKRALIVQDVNPEDYYAKDLGEQFKVAYPDAGHTVLDPAEVYDGRLPDVPNAMSGILQNICVRKPDVVFFTGRPEDLEAFVSQLPHRPCPGQPIRIMTGSAANTFAAALADNPRELGAGMRTNATVTFTALAHPDAWKQPSPVFRPEWHSYLDLDKPCKDICFPSLFPGETLDDGAVIIGYDVLGVAVHAIRSTGEVSPGAVVNQFKQMHGVKAYPGASGVFSFSATGEPINKPTPILSVLPDGAIKFDQVSYPNTTPCIPDSTYC